jgi:hypothetical protein
VSPKACTPARRVVLRLDRFGFRVTRVKVTGKALRITRRRGHRVAIVDLRASSGRRVRVRASGRTRAGRVRDVVKTYVVCARAER